MRFAPGQCVGRYVIESVLGEGGMGEVYRARDSKLARAVALKVLRKDNEASSDEWELAVGRMQREAQAVAALSHSGIVSIYDIGEQDGLPFIAMEFVDGQPLRELIGRDLSLETRIRILLDVARALGAAHDAGFVHRDIKPENILVRRDGVTKILDFGIARKLSRTADPLKPAGPNVSVGALGMTVDGALVGTPAYMSPEQLEGKVADARADQFAWSVVAYELLSGKHPFQKDTRLTQVIAAILRDEPEPLIGFPEEITSAIMRGLEKDRDHRWKSMQELLDHCEALVPVAEVRKYSTGPVLPSKGTEVTPTESRPEKPERARKPLLMISIFSAMGALIVIAFLLRNSADRPHSSVAVASPSAVSSIIRITDLPIPASTNTTAIAEFRQGIQNIRDARWGAAATAFQEAFTADPELAAAHLRYAIVQFSSNIGSARAAYRKAFGLRASMSERDQGFLHAQEPLILRDPPDPSEAAKRMEALVSKYPHDVELVYWHGQTLLDSSSDFAVVERSEQLFSRCVELDPQYADCWQSKSRALLALGKRDESLEALNECIKKSEISADCILDKIKLESHLGHCNVVVDLAHQLRAKEPVAPRGSRFLAQGLYNQGEPENVVRGAYSEAKERMKSIGLLFDSENIDLSVAVDYGEFPKALEKSEQISQMGPYPSIETEAIHYWMRAELLSEMNEVERAARLADDFLASRPLRGKFKAKRQVDLTVLMHGFRLRAGKISMEQFRKLRSEWLETQPRNSELENEQNWYAAYAVPTYSLELAREAMEAMPRLQSTRSLDQERYSKLYATFQARVYVLAEKYAQALPLLEDVVRICTTDNISLWQTQAHALLGKSREATGDQGGACRAYQVVLSRWGSSKESRTVKEVRKRRMNLRCL